MPQFTLGALALTSTPASVAADSRALLSLSAGRTYFIRASEAVLVVAGIPRDTARADSVAWLLLPPKLRIREGPFRGSLVPVPALLNGALQRWLQMGLPVIGEPPLTVAVQSDCDHEPPRSLLTAARHLSELTGQQLFLISCGGQAPLSGIGVTYGPMEKDAHLGAATVRPPCVPGQGSCTFYQGNGASVHVAYDAGPEVVAHELLHALGLGHTCLYNSIMATEFTNAELNLCAQGRARLGMAGDLRLVRDYAAEDAAALQLILDVSKYGRGLRGFNPRIVVVPDVEDAAR